MALKSYLTLMMRLLFVSVVLGASTAQESELNNEPWMIREHLLEEPYPGYSKHMFPLSMGIEPSKLYEIPRNSDRIRMAVVQDYNSDTSKTEKIRPSYANPRIVKCFPNMNCPKWNKLASEDLNAPKIMQSQDRHKRFALGGFDSYYCNHEPCNRGSGGERFPPGDRFGPRPSDRNPFSKSSRNF
ncbi:uncharacterized protein LOC142329440 [Lycorma delicatula]|uniref:uncharacterized protein LOC142329440 n=1 Tax=Lycorma delicatula TaxID=130591 RepID=UPI003F50EB3E